MAKVYIVMEHSEEMYNDEYTVINSIFDNEEAAVRQIQRLHEKFVVGDSAATCYIVKKKDISDSKHVYIYLEYIADVQPWSNREISYYVQVFEVHSEDFEPE